MDDRSLAAKRHEQSNDKTLNFPPLAPPTPTTNAVHPKQPNRLQYNEKINKIKENIRKAETERGSLANRISIKKEQLRTVREERERIARDKARVFDNVEKTNKDVRGKNDLVQKLRSGVSFSRREEIEDQVKRLETQLARSNLKLPDERKLVTEIDRLKRSKRTLQEFDKERQELERLRRDQSRAREERDEWFKAGREARGEEEQHRADMRGLGDKMEEVKARVAGLRTEQRRIEDELEVAEHLYRKHLAERRAEQRRRTELERAAQAAEEEAEMKEVAATCEPLLAERQLASALLLHCEGLVGGSSSCSTPLSPLPPGADGDNITSLNGHQGMFLALPLSAAAARRRSSGFSAYSGASSHYATPLGCSPATTPMSGSPPVSLDEDRPGFYKKKEEGSEVFFAGTAGKKTKKRNRNERRLSFRKGLNHNPETLKQFSSLGIEPPASILGVEEVITKLREKLSSLEMRAAEIKLARLTSQDIPASLNTNGVTDKDREAGEIPEITVDRSCVAGAGFKNADDSPPQVSVNGQTDRKKLSLDLKFPCIPEIKVQTSPQAEDENKDDSNTHDEIPMVLITSEDSRSSAYIDSDCDKSEPQENSRNPSHVSPNSIHLVPSQTTSTSSSENNASFSQSNGCSSLQNLVTN